MSTFWALVSSSEDIAENSIPSGISETYMNNIYKPRICSSPYWSASPPSTLAHGNSLGNTHPHFLFILSGPSTNPLLILDFGVKVFTSLEPEGRAVLIFPGSQVEFRYLATHLAETLIDLLSLLLRHSFTSQFPVLQLHSYNLAQRFKYKWPELIHLEEWGQLLEDFTFGSVTLNPVMLIFESVF